MACSTPGLPVHHQLLEFTQTHVHWISDAIQPFHPLSSSSNHFILCRPLLLPPSISPSIRVFSKEAALCIRWPKFHYHVSLSIYRLIFPTISPLSGWFHLHLNISQWWATPLYHHFYHFITIFIFSWPPWELETLFCQWMQRHAQNWEGGERRIGDHGPWRLTWITGAIHLTDSYAWKPGVPLYWWYHLLANASAGKHSNSGKGHW